MSAKNKKAEREQQQRRQHGAMQNYVVPMRSAAAGVIAAPAAAIVLIGGAVPPPPPPLPPPPPPPHFPLPLPKNNKPAERNRKLFSYSSSSTTNPRVRNDDTSILHRFSKSYSWYAWSTKRRIFIFI